MTRRNGKGRGKSREFRVVAKGFRKARRDIERLQHASLDYFNAELERQAQEERSRLLDHSPDITTPEQTQPAGDSHANR